ncbi:MAG: hypothetical protein Q7T33_02620 [Dehalococcoidia bacterium]|nr:hypothetical protein [Dehalococcoidia bacterium]
MDPFVPQHLTREETEALYQQALKAAERQLFGHRLDCVLDVKDDASHQQLRKWRGQLERLRADYAAWRAAYPDNAEGE